MFRAVDPDPHLFSLLDPDPGNKQKKGKKTGRNCISFLLSKFGQAPLFLTVEPSFLSFSTLHEVNLLHIMSRIRIEVNSWIRICKKWLRIHSPAFYHLWGWEPTFGTQLKCIRRCGGLKGGVVVHMLARVPASKSHIPGSNLDPRPPHSVVWGAADHTTYLKKKCSGQTAGWWSGYKKVF